MACFSRLASLAVLCLGFVGVAQCFLAPGGRSVSSLQYAAVQGSTPSFTTSEEQQDNLSWAPTLVLSVALGLVVGLLPLSQPALADFEPKTAEELWKNAKKAPSKEELAAKEAAEAQRVLGKAGDGGISPNRDKAPIKGLPPVEKAKKVKSESSEGSFQLPSFSLPSFGGEEKAAPGATTWDCKSGTCVKK